MEQCRGEREGRQPVRPGCAQDERRAEPDEHDPDVFNRAEREQPLEVAFHERVQDPQDGRHPTDEEQDGAPPVGPGAQHVQPDPDDPVDARVEHDPGHERRHMRRGNWMRLRQPEVERHGPRLRAEADDRQDEDHVPCRGRRARRGRPPGVEAERSAGQRGEQRECDEERGRRKMGRGEVDVARAQRPAVRPPADDQERRRQGHALPGEQERKPAARREHEQQAQQEQRVGRPQCRRRQVAGIVRGGRPLVADRVDRGRRGQRAEAHQEDPRETIRRDVERGETEHAAHRADQRPVRTQQPHAGHDDGQSGQRRQRVGDRGRVAPSPFHRPDQRRQYEQDCADQPSAAGDE